ncbi:sugar transporter [Enterobacter cancerogenus]|uniref:Sugar transporter n=1 Tax=Enterobacter cancerogenus TaxID=69218 RepID=A0A484YUL5_9ENTR|nr:sugar transporter [Enterobacter cancerogenus]
MPDNKKQGRTSNKAMTFFVCFLAALAGLLFGLDIGVIAGALPFITDEFQISSHTQGVGGQLHDVRCRRGCGGQRLALLQARA